LVGIILFGDSVFFGIGASSRSKGCGKLLHCAAKIPVLIKSRNRDTTKDALGRLEKDVLTQAGYSHVVVMFGNNDCRLQGLNTPSVSLKEYENNLREIIHKIKLCGKSPMLCNLQPISSEGFFRTLPEMKDFIDMDSTPYIWQKSYSDVCGKVSEETRIGFIDIRSPLEEEMDNIVSDDGLHPNDLGHQIIAREIIKTLKSLL